MANTLSRPMRANERRVPDIPIRPRPSSAAPINGQRGATTALGAAHKKISDALDKFESSWRDISAAEQSGNVTPEGRTQMVNDAAALPLNDIDEAEAQAADLVSVADNAYRQARSGLSPQAANATDALNHSMWWGRTARELDATPSEKLVSAVQRLIAEAAPDELGWAATELPSYLRSRSVDPDDWLAAALHQVHPGLRQAAERRKLAHQAADIIASNARTARKALASAASGSYRRPRLVSVDQYDPDA